MVTVSDAQAAAIVQVRTFLDRAARLLKVAGDRRVVAALEAVDDLDRALRAATYGPATSPTLPLRPGSGWMSTAAVADRLGITPRAVRYRIGAGTLRAARDRRGRWRIDPESVPTPTREGSDETHHDDPRPRSRARGATRQW